MHINMTTIAFLGLGAMGVRMAANLAKAGHAVTVWNRDAAKAQAFCEDGGSMAGTPHEAAMGAEIVISMVTDDVAARSVWLNQETGALGGMSAGAVANECSTVIPAWVRELGHSARAAGVSVLDASVAVSRPQAEAGQLIVMVGGGAAAVVKAEPALSTLAAKLIHVGVVGHGAVLNLAVNTLFARPAREHCGIARLPVAQWLLGRRGCGIAQQLPYRRPSDRRRREDDGFEEYGATLHHRPDREGSRAHHRHGEGVSRRAPGAESARAAFQAAQRKGLGQSNVSGLASVFA